MISKEEIEEYKNTLEELASDENVYKSIKRAVAGTFEYIQQLETREQKLIDKLEKRIKELKNKSGGNTYHVQTVINAEIREVENILSIIKLQSNKETQ